MFEPSARGMRRGRLAQAFDQTKAEHEEAFLVEILFTCEGFSGKNAYAMLQVILNQNIQGVGRRGDLISVKDGYFRNFLFPRRLAMVATHGRIKEREGRRKKQVMELEQVRENAKEIAVKLRKAVLTISAKVTKKGTLYARVGKKEILDALKDQFKVELAESHIILPEPIKKIGLYPVTIKLTEEVQESITVNVEAKS